MNKDYIEVKIPILDNVEEMEVVKTFNNEQLWYVCAIAKAFEKSEKENTNLKQALNEIREYVNKNRHLNWYVEGCRFGDILQIIDKALGDDEK